MIGASLTDKLFEMTEREQSTTALQLRSNAERERAEMAAALLEEQVHDLRKGQEALSESQKMVAAQYEARISDLRSSHDRELQAVRGGGEAQLATERAQRAALQTQLVAVQESLGRAQAEVDRLVAQAAKREHRLAQQEAELAAYRAWAAKGGLRRMFSRPEVPEVPRALLPGEG